LLLLGLRNLFAGVGLFIFAVRRNPVWPSAAEIRNAGLVGTMLVGLSSGMLAYGMRTVGTGTAAVMVATVPLFATVVRRALPASAMNCVPPDSTLPVAVPPLAILCVPPPCTGWWASRS
jgi:hypothetical protein